MFDSMSDFMLGNVSGVFIGIALILVLIFSDGGIFSVR